MRTHRRSASDPRARRLSGGHKPLREASTRTIGEARALDARRRARQSAQWTASAAVLAAVLAVARNWEARAAQREAVRAEQLRDGFRGGRGGRGGR